MTNTGAAIARGVLKLQVDGGQHSANRAHLLDVSGRKMMDLKPGANDVRALAPGVYFVAAGLGIRGQGLGRIRKVVLTR
jgi:hypothetical protein